jgi:hypothetical protein
VSDSEPTHCLLTRRIGNMDTPTIDERIEEAKQLVRESEALIDHSISEKKLDAGIRDKLRLNLERLQRLKGRDCHRSKGLSRWKGPDRSSPSSRQFTRTPEIAGMPLTTGDLPGKRRSARSDLYTKVRAPYKRAVLLPWLCSAQRRSLYL